MSHPDDEVLVDLAITGPDAADASPARARPPRHLRDLLQHRLRAAPHADPHVAGSIRCRLGRPAGEPVVEDRRADRRPRDHGCRPRTPGVPDGSGGHGRGDPGAGEPGSRRIRRRGSGRAAQHPPRPGGEPATAPRRLGGRIAAAGLAIGLLTGRALWNEPAPASTTVSQVALDTLDASDPQRLGEAAVVRTAGGYELTVDTSTPLDAGDGYLEVWLINRDLKRMVSVGVLGSDGPASFPISQALIDQGYVVVDISREHYDDQPGHSGDSVVRGKLPA